MDYTYSYIDEDHGRCDYNYLVVSPDTTIEQTRDSMTGAEREKQVLSSWNLLAFSHDKHACLSLLQYLPKLNFLDYQH